MGISRRIKMSIAVAGMAGVAGLASGGAAVAEPEPGAEPRLHIVSTNDVNAAKSAEDCPDGKQAADPR
ncbi:hypothetical protein [Spirillospora sp. CA-294931]|uniref:hypothetical protein n=1 Tax=Spirillospora sp. CA-294931 TaxID=3240042 RepID=UPI003D8BEDF0